MNGADSSDCPCRPRILAEPGPGRWVFLKRRAPGACAALADGWFPTADIATIDPQGTVQIRDRAKDLIKTGGEWISSIEVENAAVGHPAVAMAAVIGVRHPRWEERPLLLIVRQTGTPSRTGGNPRVPGGANRQVVDP
jgi:acyl-CoA synthetase (AMP-forming)/AMP-acid ligase II